MGAISAIRALIARFAAAIARVTTTTMSALMSPIGFQEVLLLSGAGLLGYGAYLVYPPAGFIAAGSVIAGVAIFGVR